MSEMQLLLEKRIRRTAVQDAAMALVVLVLAIVVLAAAASRARATIDGRTAMMVAVGAAFLWAAWVMGAEARRLFPPRASRVFRELSSDGRGVGWVHLTQGAFSALKVYFLDGGMCTLYADAGDAGRLLDWVAQIAPHAIVGFGTEQQRAYAERVAQHQARQS